MRIAIITSLCGDIDQIHTPKTHFKNADYYAFGDMSWKVKVWKQLPIYKFSQDDKYKRRRNAKLYKILPELFIPGYDYYIYHDPSHEVIKDPEWIINEYMHNSVMGVFKHNERDCVYDEANKLCEWGYDYPRLINEWYSYLKDCEYPEHDGLYELPVFIKKNCVETMELSLMWWEIICKYSSRDQLSLPYCIWKLHLEHAISILPGYANGRKPDGSIGMNDIMPQVYEKVR